jgi:RNA polymerase sigma-70 factor (ECF subfamily)
MLAVDCLTEQELLQRVSEGNELAFRQIFDNYHHLLGAHIFRLTDSMETAEEIVQDVFIKMWDNREELRDIRNLKAYLFVISRNQALNALKKSLREQKHYQKWQTEQQVSENLDNQEPVFNNHYHLLDLAINQLPPQQQKVYLMSRHERLKYAEIAMKMNISRETVKKYLQLAVGFISSYLRENTYLLVLLFIYSNL